MKKLCSLLLAAMLLLTAACGAKTAVPAEEDRLSIVTTIFPEYDWVRRVLGDEAAHVDVTLLLGTGVDMHSFQPSAADIVKVAGCDLFVYVGGESDAWAEDALAEAVNPDMIAVNLMDVLGSAAVAEELTEGMTAEAEPEEDGPEYDEHVWLSLRNAQTACAALAEALAALDPDRADAYRENAAAYGAELAALDAEYAAACASAAHDTLLFGDRFPFRYLCEDYGLSYYAAFPGCSAETEASFETVAFLAGKLQELDLPAVLVTESADRRIAETILENAGGDRPILTLDSMQSVTAADAADGTTYLHIMEQNLAVLDAALNG